ncbi:MAG: rhomboid family intramembrane serine protease [Legionella sp.]|uniref:rhomboid family intramembrane serine protease n=1 Tax=Legionella sp. TaxID=459 RepID=UPI0039E67942
MLDNLISSLNLIIMQTQNNSAFLAAMLIILWTVFFITRIDKKLLYQLGITPRKLNGLAGVIFAPFLHVNFNHLFFNCVPLVVLSNFILVYGLPYFLLVTVMITVLSGLAIWCFAKSGVHVGASGVITGYWAFLVSNIYQNGSLTAIILGLISLYYFAGIFFGIFPNQKGVSWEAHLFGFLAGLATDYLLKYYPEYFTFILV